MDTRKTSNGRDFNRIPLWKVAPRSIPFSIGIAPSDVCNFRCVYCNQSTPAGIKDGRIMAWEDFLILADQISELAEIGKTKGERIMNIRFIGNGEPLTNKRLPDMIANLRARNICERFEVTTNASLLTNDMSDRLIESGLTRLLVSIQGTTAEKYKEVCGYNLDMQNFLSQLEYFYAHRKDCKVYIKTIDVALDGKDDEQKFMDMFSPLCDNIGIEKTIRACADVNYDTFAPGDIDTTTRYGTQLVEKKCCDVLFMYLNIHSMGKVDSCGCVYPPLFYGNIFKKPLKDIWNGEEHKKIMRLHLQGKRKTLERCRTCASCEHYNGFESDNLDRHLAEILERVEAL